MSETTLSNVPCPCCGCWTKKEFLCGCGEIHDDYCGNCGRWVSLPSDKCIDLGMINARCEQGRVLHEHSQTEKTKRIEAYFAMSQAERERPELFGS